MQWSVYRSVCGSMRSAAEVVECVYNSGMEYLTSSVDLIWNGIWPCSMWNGIWPCSIWNGIWPCSIWNGMAIRCMGSKYLFMSFSFLVRSEVSPESTVSAATHAEGGERWWERLGGREEVEGEGRGDSLRRM